MQCINKIKAGWTSAGDLTFSKKKASKELVGFDIDCRKCLPCRLNTAREKAIRCWHESRVHKESIFLTLTYAPEHLKSDRLNYQDFQLFMKSLRELVTRDVTDLELKKELSISYMVTGEYGELNKRPHWHALIFNYRPSDLVFLKETELGHKTFYSPTIEKLWGKNSTDDAPNVIGDVTLDSASYVARYASKKLVHGQDQEHDYHPIHKTSSKNALGKKWIEQYWERTFNEGNVVLPDGCLSKIPRYYVDWLKKNKPDEWRRYVTQKRLELQEKAALKSRKEEMLYLSELMNLPWGYPRPITRSSVSLTILQQKFKRLQEKLKL